MSDCLFCKIVAGEIPSKKVFEDELCYAFYDISPQAPTHFLVIPKEHLSGANKVTEAYAPLVGHIFAVIAKITSDLGCGDDFRIISNCGPMAGQSVEHLHFHILAGRELAWPPG